MAPDDFIPLTEETGLITEIGKWVLDHACSQAAAWRSAGYTIGMAVNVSARQLDSDQLIDDIQKALADTGLEPGALTIEITETTLMRNVEETARRLAAVKQLGVRVAIDDFGTGYSSLAHLQRFPVDALKIDRSFIAGLSQNKEGETLIHTLVQLGKALSIETFAEGIEQQQQLSKLRDEHCDSGQGFLFARPLDVAATEAFMQSAGKTGAVAPRLRQAHRGARRTLGESATGPAPNVSRAQRRRNARPILSSTQEPDWITSGGSDLARAAPAPAGRNRDFRSLARFHYHGRSTRLGFSSAPVRAPRR